MRNLKLIMPLLLLLCSIHVIAQDESTDNDNSTPPTNGVKGFHAGFFAGAFFANNYSASLYDGYGIDANTGTKNSFINSALVQRMIVNGMDSANCRSLNFQSSYTDVISQALGVSGHDQWHFNTDDMPSGLKYSVAFQFGLNFQYGISKTEGIILNTNFAKLNVTGTFTIGIPSTVNPYFGDSVLYFGISGQEQRFMFQLGYSRLLGDPDAFNVVVEGGILMNSAKYLNNYATINNLKLDLTPFTVNQGYQNNYLPTQYNAIGFGAFAGIGFNINLNAKYIIQVLYSPSYEKINIGDTPASNLQQSLGLRVYYNL